MKFWKFLIVLFLLVVFFIVSFTAIRDKSPTFDETVHLTSGYCYWKMNDYRMNPENGNFPQRWAAIPLLFDDSINLPDFSNDSSMEYNQWLTSYAFLYKSGNDPELMFLKARSMMILLGCSLGLAIFFISKEVFGFWGGIVSLLFYSVCPNIIANSSLVTSDIAAALGFVLSAWTLWKLMHKISIKNVIVASFSVSLLCISKMSAALLLPVFLAMLAVRLAVGKRLFLELFRVRKFIKGKWSIIFYIVSACIPVILSAWLTIWAAYGFRFEMINSNVSSNQKIERNWGILLHAQGFSDRVVGFAREMKLLPDAYLYGFQFVKKKSMQRYAYVNELKSVTGWWWFFPYAFLIKTPLPLIILLIFVPSLFWLGLRKHKGESPILKCKVISSFVYKFVPFIAVGSVYLLFSMSSNINIGLRHIIVVYPCAYILLGAIWLILKKSHSLSIRAFLVGMLLWAIFESFSIYPDYLAYFNQIAGGAEKGYLHLVDSSLDWGQDLSTLACWLKKNGFWESPNVYLSYFGTASIDHYLKAKKLPSYMGQEGDVAFELKGGIYCISATMRTMIYLRELFLGYDLKKYGVPDDKMFEELKSEISELIEAMNTDTNRFKSMVDSKGSEYWISRYRLYSILRFIKLCSYIKDMKPVEQIGHSILVYFLDDKDISEAMTVPLEFEKNVL